MTSASTSRTIRAPGRLVIGPTDLALAFPYGGVEVGRTRLVVLQSQVANFRVECEGRGGEPSDVLEGSNRYVFACFLRGWDDDAVEQLLADGYTEGAVTGHAVFDAPGAVTPGTSALNRGRVLLYVPDDVENVPAVLAFNGIPTWTEGAEMAFQRGDELGIPLAIDCLRNAAGRILQVGRLADLSLTP